MKRYADTKGDEHEDGCHCGECHPEDSDSSCCDIESGDEGTSDEVWLEDIALKEAISKLSEKERSIISARYYAGKTQMEIAQEIGISQAQVSRLEKGAFERIRKSF